MIDIIFRDGFIQRLFNLNTNGKILSLYEQTKKYHYWF